jgi:hypothetical protein
VKHSTVRGQIIQLLCFFTYPSCANISRINTANENMHRTIGTGVDLQARQGFGGLISTKMAVAYATGRASHARQVKGDDPDKKDTLVLQVGV